MYRRHKLNCIYNMIEGIPATPRAPDAGRLDHDSVVVAEIAPDQRGHVYRALGPRSKYLKKALSGESTMVVSPWPSAAS